MKSKTNRDPKFDVSKFKALHSQGKTVQQIANKTGASYPWVRFSLQKQGVQLAHRTHAVTRPMSKSNAIQMGGKDFVEAIARAVASATMSDAQLIPQAKTRDQMFNDIREGVKEGVKKLNIGFHS